MTRNYSAPACARAVALPASLIVGLLVAPPDCGIASAAFVDLTTAGSSGSIVAAEFDTNIVQATGTGGFDTFVQQSPQGNGTISRAYNTTVNNVLDNKSADNFNYSIELGDAPVVNRAGVPSLKFSLDLNESIGGGAEFISLDEVQIFVGGTPNSNVDTFTLGILDHDGTLVYQLDAGGDDWVAMNANLNSGSGAGDVDMYLPLSLFSGFAASDVVTLYSQFGLQGVDPAGFTGDFGASGGFEEWGLAGVPEPSTARLVLSVLALAVFRRRAG
ncbi:hypothetical protein Pla123a_18140 [Posidoniimonas polymericola]|uniref:PEP-CTERM protein-sorting domain-containing protein n=1 Tax=Posidoniimonas polymericola TaxID=2528002 RepID=A0A5C5YSN1_9BACT|nr:hypothetical protein [Posidoniimonas polymericola]TWT78014.1 hypothetical protein Pla123a_18140 [Posidoniimonas polymericola]